jgi:6,7-dimethyl-8-ribityllumazine synthase
LVKRSLDTPSGKLALAGVIKGGGKGVDWIASKLKISVDNLTEFLVQRGIKVDNGVLGAIGANQLLRQLKEEDK